MHNFPHKVYHSQSVPGPFLLDLDDRRQYWRQGCIPSGLVNFAFWTTLLSPHVYSLCSLTTYRQNTRKSLRDTRNPNVEDLKPVASLRTYRPLSTSLPTRYLVFIALKSRVDSA